MAESKTKDAPQVTPTQAEETADELLSTSSDARFSIYREATPEELDLADENLPPGPHTMQERGEPSESAPDPFGSRRKR